MKQKQCVFCGKLIKDFEALSALPLVEDVCCRKCYKEKIIPVVINKPASRNIDIRIKGWERFSP